MNCVWNRRGLCAIGLVLAAAGAARAQLAVEIPAVQNPNNGHYYLLLDQGSWDEANATAAFMGGYLTAITDLGENQWIHDNVVVVDGVDRRAWIGLTDRDIENTFEWTDGEDAFFGNWLPGEPNNNPGGGIIGEPGEDYIEMDGNPGDLDDFRGGWNDATNLGNPGNGIRVRYAVVEFDEPVGACDVGGVCTPMTSADCAAAAGSYAGDFNFCAGPLPLGACCLLNGSCVQTTADDCTTQSIFGAGITAIFWDNGSDCGGITCANYTPPNDECVGAEILALDVPVHGTTVNASQSTTASCGFQASDVWYVFAPLPETRYRVSTANAQGNISIAAFLQECPPSGAEFACNDATGIDGLLEFTADAIGSAVFIRVASDEFARTDFDVTIAELPGACAGVDGLCRQMTPTDCAASGGAFAGGACATGACCDGEFCSVATTGGCADAGGTYHGDGTNCGDYSADDTIAYNFEDISATGTLITLADDAVSNPQPLGFTFNYYGTDYTEAYVSSNGFLTLTPNTNAGCCTGQIVPQPTSVDFYPDGVIAFWWEDFNPLSGGAITVQTLGTAPNRLWILQFTDINHYNFVNPTQDPVTLQVKLFEGANSIEMHYQSLTTDGGDHTIGIENQDGTVGVSYFRGTTLPPAGASFAVSFAQQANPCTGGPACACETDGDANQVNVFDLLSYLDLWFPSAPAADIDGTAGVNVFDLLFYLDCWFPASAGNPCP
jgi:hypothetical protein